MKKMACFLFPVLILALYSPSLIAATYNWGTTGVADTSRVREIIQLTNNSADNSLESPSSYFLTSPWNSDGSWLVYKVYDSLTGAGICKMHAASGHRSCLTDGFLTPSESVQNPSFGTDNRIYFEKITSTDNEIWRMNSDGTNKENITLAHGGSDEQYVKVSPDGQWIAFLHNNGLWVVKSDGPSLSPAPVSGSVQVDRPQYSWSPDSQWLVYQGADGANKWVYKAKVDGTVNIPLTDPGLILDQHTHLWPTWSPDGKKIAFVWSTWDGLDTDYTIQTIDEDGQTLQSYLDHANTASTEWKYLNNSLSWSPDSQWLTYVKQGSGDKAIFITNVEDPTQKAQLTGGYADNTPIWSPAGNRILFTDGGPG